MNAISPRQYETMRRVLEGRYGDGPRPLATLIKHGFVTDDYDGPKLTVKGENSVKRYASELERLAKSIRT